MRRVEVRFIWLGGKCLRVGLVMLITLQRYIPSSLRESCL